MRVSLRALAAGLAGSVATAAVLLACRAPVQRIPLDLEPAGARIFVDGREVPGVPAALELRADRPHVVHVRRDGYQAEQIVLEPRDGGAGPHLEPAEIRLRLAPIVPTEREIRIEGGDS